MTFRVLATSIGMGYRIPYWGEMEVSVADIRRWWFRKRHRLIGVRISGSIS